MTRRRTICPVYWGTHGCDKRYPHRNHRCNCGMVVDRDGRQIKPVSEFDWQLFRIIHRDYNDIPDIG